MRPNGSGITRASTSHTIGSLQDRRIFVTRSSGDLTTCDTIRRRSKTCSIPFFDSDVELFMRTYIAWVRQFRRLMLADVIEGMMGGSLRRVNGEEAASLMRTGLNRLISAYFSGGLSLVVSARIFRMRLARRSRRRRTALSATLRRYISRTC